MLILLKDIIQNIVNYVNRTSARNQKNESIRLKGMTLQHIFIANLKKKRKERGISQMALSKMCDTTSNYIGQIEMGRRIPSFDKIEEIASALGIAPHELFIFDKEAEKEEKKLNTKDYLMKMPADVKKEIISNLLFQIEKNIGSCFDIKNYG